MRHKKRAVFFTITVMFFTILAFLLIHEESPLNRYFREEDARNLYNQALEFHENKDYSSAIHTLETLTDEHSRGFWGRYSDTAYAKRAQAEELFPY